MQKISVMESWGVAWKAFKNNWLIVLYAALVPAIISSILGAIQSGVSEKMQAGAVLLLLGIIYFVGRFLLSMLLNIGAFKIQLGVMNGVKPAFSDLFKSFGVYWKFIGATVLYGLVVLGGLILLIIPGIYFAIKYMFVPYLVVDKKMGIGEAFNKSKEITFGNKWAILGFIVVTIIFSLLGIVVLFVGVFVTSAIGYLSMIHLYKKLMGEGVANSETVAISDAGSKTDDNSTVISNTEVQNTNDVETKENIEPKPVENSN